MNKVTIDDLRGIWFEDIPAQGKRAKKYAVKNNAVVFEIELPREKSEVDEELVAKINALKESLTPFPMELHWLWKDLMHTVGGEVIFACKDILVGPPYTVAGIHAAYEAHLESIATAAMDW